MKVKIYLKNSDPGVEEVLVMENVRADSVLGFKSLQVFAATGMFTFTTQDGKRLDIIPRENIERITCHLDEDLKAGSKMPIVEEVSDEDMEEFEIDLPEIGMFGDGQDEEMDFLFGGGLDKNLFDEEEEDES